jgi:hypothetical protein
VASPPNDGSALAVMMAAKFFGGRDDDDEEDEDEDEDEDAPNAKKHKSS